jgi:hypothetical protein
MSLIDMDFSNYPAKVAAANETGIRWQEWGNCNKWVRKVSFKKGVEEYEVIFLLQES